MSDDERRDDILRMAYDTLDGCAELDERLAAREAARDPNQRDAMEEWQRLRNRSREPAARQQQAPAQPDWQRWCDERIGTVFDNLHSAVSDVVGEQFGKTWAQQRKLSDEISRLRRELDHMRSELKMIQQSKAAAITGWVADPRNYRVQLTMSDGRPGPILNLRSIFERYHQEAAH